MIAPKLVPCDLFVFLSFEAVPRLPRVSLGFCTLSLAFSAGNFLLRVTIVVSLASSPAIDSSSETGENVIFLGDVIGDWGKGSTGELDFSDSLSVSASNESRESLRWSWSVFPVFLASLFAFFVFDLVIVNSFSGRFSEAVFFVVLSAFRDPRFAVNFKTGGIKN